MAANCTVLTSGAEASGVRPPTNGNVAIASINGVVGLDLVDASMVWKTSSREVGNIMRNFACKVWYDLLRIVSDVPPLTASKVSSVIRMLWIDLPSCEKSREPQARCFAKRGEWPVPLDGSCEMLRLCCLNET